MGVISAIVIGFIVGLLARALMPGDQKSGIIVTTLLGIGGSIVGKYIGQGLGWYREDQPAGFLMSIVGAMILLFVFHLLRRNQTR